MPKLLIDAPTGENKDYAVEVMDHLTHSLCIVIRLFLHTAKLPVTNAYILSICIAALNHELIFENDKEVKK